MDSGVRTVAISHARAPLETRRLLGSTMPNKGWKSVPGWNPGRGRRDQRLWKIIISPEFGDRVDLTRLTRDMMARVERDLGMPLEWVAVAHFNTEHPHVHVALRGLGRDAQQVRLNRDYVKHGFRSIAEDLCTRQLGHRTEIDAAEAEHREIRENRFTSLDRMIARAAQPIAEVLPPRLSM